MGIVSRASKLAWEKHPNAKKIYKEIAENFPLLGIILAKQENRESLTDLEKKYINSYYLTVHEKYPNLTKEIGQIQKEILESWGFYNENKDIDELIELSKKEVEESLI